MTSRSYLADIDHPLLEKKAAELTLGKQSSPEKLESISNFVRDEIRLGFTLIA